MLFPIPLSVYFPATRVIWNSPNPLTGNKKAWLAFKSALVRGAERSQPGHITELPATAPEASSRSSRTTAQDKENQQNGQRDTDKPKEDPADLARLAATFDEGFHRDPFWLVDLFTPYSKGLRQSDLSKLQNTAGNHSRQTRMTP